MKKRIEIDEIKWEKRIKRKKKKKYIYIYLCCRINETDCGGVAFKPGKKNTDKIEKVHVEKRKEKSKEKWKKKKKIYNQRKRKLREERKDWNEGIKIQIEFFH